MKSAKRRVIVITGAAAGVGRATAKMFAETEGGLIARGMEGLASERCEWEPAIVFSLSGWKEARGDERTVRARRRRFFDTSR